MPALLIVLLALAAPAWAEDVPLGISARYACAGGETLRVAYLNPKDGPSLAVVDWEGRLAPMEAGPTGSGVRYVAYEGGLVWHSKGREGTLLREDAGGEQVLLGDCREKE